MGWSMTLAFAFGLWASDLVCHLDFDIWASAYGIATLLLGYAQGFGSRNDNKCAKLVHLPH
jgi:hypothetical protein